MDIYKSQETFEFNGKTYNKVLVTSNWNNIAVRQFETSFYNEYTIPEGSYDYNELVTEIVNVFNQFFIDNNISGSVQIDKFKFNSYSTGTLINSLLYIAPPGNAHFPLNGSFFLFIKSTFISPFSIVKIELTTWAPIFLYKGLFNSILSLPVYIICVFYTIVNLKAYFFYFLFY